MDSGCRERRSGLNTERHAERERDRGVDTVNNVLNFMQRISNL